MKYTLGLLGAGNMAEAIVKAAIDRQVVAPDRIIASDPSEQRRQLFASLGVAVTADNREVIGQSSQVMLAVKPQMFPKVIDELAQCCSSEQVLLSIMAGITIAKLNDSLTAAGGRPMRVVRIMPNTPMLVGQGMAGVAVAPPALPGDDELAMRLFAAGGQAIRVEEPMIDTITAISGSGPAYVFYLAEAMQDAAAELGLGEHGRTLAAQTLLGAATLLLQSPDSAAELRRKVTSPGGTTEAAIRHMESLFVKQTLIDAMKAAHRRARELGR